MASGRFERTLDDIADSHDCDFSHRVHTAGFFSEPTFGQGFATVACGNCASTLAGLVQREFGSAVVRLPKVAS
jgi:hypothetical protein